MHTITNWQNEWDAYNEGRQSKLFLQGPDTKFKQLLFYGRETISKLIRFITGHSFMKVHNNIVKYGTKFHGQDNTCQLCEEGEDNRHHIVTECPVLDNPRIDIFGSRVLPQNFTHWKLPSMVEFLNLKLVQNLDKL